jgi:hypothetical protein
MPLRDVIFTCTTYFDYPNQDKWAVFCRGMDQLLKLHSPATLERIGAWMIVNEYSDQPKEDWVHKLAVRYPFMTCIQKAHHQRGQASSLNLCLDYLSSYLYWIQWEESWYPQRECLERGLSIMQTTEITQLQLTGNGTNPDWLGTDWLDRCIGSYFRVEHTPEVCHIHYSADQLRTIQPWDARTLYTHPMWGRSWPLYSLRPSINRVSFYTFGPFRTEPDLWPVKFEWEYARRWLEHGGHKAVLPDGPVQRDPTHCSTYAFVFERSFWFDVLLTALLFFLALVVRGLSTTRNSK